MRPVGEIEEIERGSRGGAETRRSFGFQVMVEPSESEIVEGVREGKGERKN
jgi:hypothetical protein